MSFEQTTSGWEKYEVAVKALQAAGIEVTEGSAEELQALGQEQLVRGWASEHFCYCVYSGDECPCCTGTCEHLQRLRLAYFITKSGQEMVVEEWLAMVDNECNGDSLVEIAIYPKGQRPQLITQVYPE